MSERAPNHNIPELSPMDQRIIGSLMEKHRTVPAGYPLSLNALRTACNQSSSRDPVTDYDPQTLETGVRELKHRDLVKVIWAGKGSRTPKYHELLTEQLLLAEDEAALITVLLLRGAQAPGELRTRTERMHPFADRDAVAECLGRLADRGLVRRLERRPGQQDHRWIHVLGPIAGAEPEPAPVAVDREVVLAGGAADRDARVLAGYEQVAQQPLDPAEPHPFDAWLVARLAGLGPIVDVGCGTGWASGLLAAMDAQVTGVDRSPAMVAAAAAAHPGARFETGDLTRLLRPPAAPAWGAIIAWDVFGHLAGSELDEAVAALVRVLAPEGWLLLAVRIGNEVLPTDHYLGHEVEVPLVLHDPDRVRQAVTGAGLSIAERYVRGAEEADEADLLVLMAYTPAVTG